MPTFVKSNFSGGINQFADETRIDVNSQQWLLVNGRNRRGVVDTIRLPLDITGTLPIAGGNIQGLYAVGNYLVVFVNGLAYYSPRDPILWTKITNFQMSATAERLYLELIPASSINLERRLRDEDDVEAGVSRLSQGIAPSPRAAIVMDGESQPWLIFPDLTARVTKAYSEWTTADPEYVPIGTLPMWHTDGILYCVVADADGNFTQIAHSVSGQPVNFVIRVDTTGAKAPLESEGGASALAHRVDYDEISCMRRISAVQSAFLVTTLRNSYLTIPDYDNLIFSEPQFGTQFLFSVGAKSQDSVVDVRGDTALISFRGIRSFNGVNELQNQGNNDPFSLPINDLVGDTTQGTVACISFDNYAVFSLTTKYGPGVLWYDTMTKVWVSLDIYPNVGLVQQFAAIQTAEALELFFFTDDNKLYHAFASPQTAQAGVYIGALVPGGTSRNEHRITRVRASFSEIREAGTVQCFVTSGRVRTNTQAKLLAQSSAAQNSTESVPFDTELEDDTTPVTFDFSADSALSYKAGVMLEWDAQARLLEVVAETEEVPRINNSSESVPAILVSPDTMIFVGDDGWDTPTREMVFDAMMAEEGVNLYVGCGDHSYVESDPENAFFKWWRYMLERGKFIAVPGNHDQDGDSCRTFREFMRMQPSRYFRHQLQYTSLYMFNAGLKTDGTQLEPDNEDQPQFVDCKQPRWLQSGLIADSKPHRIAVMHQPPYTSGTRGGTALFQQLPYRTWGASAVISGHNHALERVVKDGMTYLVSGGGGSSLYLQSATPLAETMFYQPVHGYLIAKAYPLTIEFTFKNAQTQEILDQYTVRKVG